MNDILKEPSVIHKELCSPREQVARDLVDFTVCASMSEVYAGGYSKLIDKKGKSYYSIPFCRARTLDGEIRVYSERFIYVSWNTTYRTMPAEGREVFKSKHEARDFLTRNFVF